MTVFFTAGFLLCIGYWILTALYAGQLLAQNEIWLFLGAGFLLNAAAAHGWRNASRYFSLPVVTALHTAFFALLACIAAAGIVTASGLHPKRAGGLDYIVVLGAALRPDQKISRTLAVRLDQAAETAAENPGAQIVLSGGSDERGEGSEAEVMAEELTRRGVAPQRLLLEIQSKNTYENITYSLALIDRVRSEKGPAGNPARVGPGTGHPILSAETRPLRVGIVSSDYHMYRAVHIARKQSAQQIFGIACASDPVLLPHYMLRESIALLKDKFLGRL